MAVKPDKSRIMFTTDSSFESFLRDMCFRENRNMSNLVDTILKNHYKDSYDQYLSSIDKTIYEIVKDCNGDDYANMFTTKLNDPTIPFGYKLEVRNRLVHSSEDLSSAIHSIKEEIQKIQTGIIFINNKSK